MNRAMPFHIKRVDRAKLRIDSSTRLEQSQIHVNLLLHERKIPHFDSLRASTQLRIEAEVLRDTKPHLSEHFVRLLRFTSHPASFFPETTLASYSSRSYYLLLERGMAREALELWGRDIHRDRSLHLSGYRLQIIVAPLIREEAYLVARDKYCVYLYPKCDADGIRIFRSDFIDLILTTPPPLTFHSQDVLEALQLRLAQHLGVPVETINPEPPAEELDQCPSCGGPVQHLGGNAHFCLECDWDNLTPISRGSLS